MQRKYFIKFAVHYLIKNKKQTQLKMRKLLISLVLIFGFTLVNAQTKFPKNSFDVITSQYFLYYCDMKTSNIGYNIENDDVYLYMIDFHGLK